MSRPNPSVRACYVCGDAPAAPWPAPGLCEAHLDKSVMPGDHTNVSGAVHGGFLVPADFFERGPGKPPRASWLRRQVQAIGDAVIEQAPAIVGSAIGAAAGVGLLLALLKLLGLFK